MSELMRYIDLKFDFTAEQMRRYEVDDKGCWNWTGRVKEAREPYGRIDYSLGTRITRRVFCAHRVSYAYHNGADPGGMMVTHLCDNPRCINPDHLRLGTHADNMRDMAKKGRGTRGEANHHCLLRESAIIEIIDQIRAGKSNMEIAKSLPVTHSQISQIRLGKSWRHITGKLDYNPEQYRRRA